MKTMMKCSRRSFTKLAAVAVLVPGRVFAGDGDKNLIRPPGAMDEVEFLARCNRCQRCVQVCPTRVVVPAAFDYGIIACNTPVMSFKRSYCNSCLKCSEVCPTGALKPVTAETLDIGIAAIVERDCVAWDWIGCTVCVDVCPLKAITLDEQKRPVVDLKKCNGCGLCELKCPASSLGKKSGKGILIQPRQEGMPRRSVLPVSEGSHSEKN